MGRHSSDKQFRYYRSVAGWFLPWALVAAVAVTAMWIAVDAIGQEDLDARPPAGSATEEPSPSPTPEQSPSPRVSPSPKKSPSPSPTASPKEEDKDGDGNKKPPKDEKKEGEDQPPPLITSGISVQVLNGSSSAVAGEVMAGRLADLGFEVAAVAGATPYAETTVFWSFDDARTAAQRLASRFGWVAAPKPANLSSTVDLHVVVGDDEA